MLEHKKLPDGWVAITPVCVFGQLSSGHSEEEGQLVTDDCWRILIASSGRMCGRNMEEIGGCEDGRTVGHNVDCGWALEQPFWRQCAHRWPCCSGSAGVSNVFFYPKCQRAILPLSTI